MTLGVVVVVVVVAAAGVAVTVVVFGSAGAAVVAVVVAGVSFGSAMAVVVVRSPTVVRLVDCTGGGLWAPACRPGAAAQPAAMIPSTPTRSSARRRPPRPVACVTGAIVAAPGRCRGAIGPVPSLGRPNMGIRRTALCPRFRPDSVSSAGFGGVAQLVERRLCKP